MRTRTRNIGLAAAAVVFGITSSALAVDDVYGGALFTLTTSSTVPNGAWSWFEDERAIIDRSDPANPRLLVSSVSSAANGNAESGDIDLLWRNLATGVQGEFELSNQLERDDHNSAALYQRPDGRYLAMYGKHGSDSLTRWRISTNPGDPTSWSAEQTLTNPAGATYNNIYYLANDRNGAGRLYNFTRTVGYDPYIQTSNDQGTTWSLAGQLLTEGGGSDRPYVRYASDGTDKIHFITTDRHPRDFQNNIYHGYISDGRLYNTDGTLIDANSFDAAAPAPNALTRIFTNGSSSNGTTMNRAWTISLELDKAKNPVAIFTTRANDSNQDHRFFYARHDGIDWRVNEMAAAGGFLYSSETDYTGLASIDPENPNVVYMSTRIDPRDGSTTGKYELYKGFTADFGTSWDWSAITENSTVDNLRPLVPSWDGDNKAVVWMRGTYSSYTNWNTEVVGLKLASHPQKSQLWRGTHAVQPGLWDIGTTANWDSGGGLQSTYGSGDEVTFDDSATVTSIQIAVPVTPMGVAFHNKTKQYTLNGAGIGGVGELRVAGGGRVTLANGANTYTGETKIGNGTLALSGNATLANTSHIRVMERGTLDLSAAATGRYTLAGRKMTVDGAVVGHLRATAGAEVILNASNAIQGSLAVSQSIVSGEGGVTGNVSVEPGGVLRVGKQGLDAITTRTPVTYFDATTANTRAYDNVSFPNGTWKADFTTGNVGDGTDNRWDHRTTFANGGNIISSNNVGSPTEDAPLLQTTITGLTPGESYDVLGYFWNSNGTNWRMKASIDSAQINNNGTAANLADDYLPTNASVAFAAHAAAGWTNAPAVANGHDGGDNLGVAFTGSGSISGGNANLTSGVAQGYFTSNVLVGEGNRALYQASIGKAVADANGNIVVYVDDNANGGQANRTWYDGVGVRQSWIAPAAGIIDFHVGGDLSMAAGSRLELDVYGEEAFDRLVVAGAASIGGTLAIDLFDPSHLQRGDQVRVLTAASVDGQFDSVSNVRFSQNLALAITYAADGVDLTVAIPGDADLNQQVDFSDLLTLAQNYNSSAVTSWSTGDFDGDGLTNFNDLLTLAQFYGAGTAAFQADIALAFSLVPEPGTAAALLMAASFAGGRRRR